MTNSAPTPPEPVRQQTQAGALNRDEYRAVSDFLEQQAGIRLGAGKEYLVSSRLKPVLEAYQLPNMAALVNRLRAHDRAVGAHVVDAMTTNETFWFRDPAHYRALTEDILPSMSGQLARIWSAAASSGQEAYSIAMSIQDAQHAGRLSSALRYQILGTDISTNALRAARDACYCGVQAARGLTQTQQNRYFEREGGCVRVREQYRRDIEFRQFNLLDTFTALGRFDVIFCRNVLIYFSQERKRNIIERFAQSLNPGGYLFLSSTESMAEHTDLYVMESLGGGLAYRRK